MANTEHLEILEQGVEAWNIWRVKNPDVRPDLQAANLTKCYLPDINFSKANFYEANLREGRF